MNLSKGFYEFLISLVNEGYKESCIDCLMEASNILVFSTGDIRINTDFLCEIIEVKNRKTALTIVSQPSRIEALHKKIHGDDVSFFNWKGRYTKSVLDYLIDNKSVIFDSVLYFGSTPVAASNCNLLGIADFVLDSPHGKGCFVYSFVDNTLYEYKNIHSFYSAIEINEHINRILAIEKYHITGRE